MTVPLQPRTTHIPSRREQIRCERARRASDVAKVGCPYCGGLTSSVYVSKPAGLRTSDGYRRRRACAECVDAEGRPRTFPTIEHLDWRRLDRELADHGVTRHALVVGKR
jgi:hypothetical protein